MRTTEDALFSLEIEMYVRSRVESSTEAGSKKEEEEEESRGKSNGAASHEGEGNRSGLNVHAIFPHLDLRLIPRYTFQHRMRPYFNRRRCHSNKGKVAVARERWQ